MHIFKRGSIHWFELVYEGQRIQTSARVKNRRNRRDVEDIALPNYTSLAVITQYTTSKWLLEQELKARGKWAKNPDGTYRYGPNDDAYLIAAEYPAVGLCLSGGGIRSATFALGVLQGFAGAKLLPRFDYLATVSGGSYIHQFLSSWIMRIGSIDEVEIRMEPFNIASPDGEQNAYYTSVQPEAIDWLRRHSKDVIPQLGLFAASDWVVLPVITRNSALNLLVLLSFLFPCLPVLRFAISQNLIGFFRSYQLVAGSLSTPLQVSYALTLFLCVLTGSVALGTFFWPTLSFSTAVRRATHFFNSSPVISVALLPIALGAALASPSAYRSLVPFQPYTANNAPELFCHEHDALLTETHETHSVDKSYIVRTVEHVKNTPYLRLAANFQKKPKFPSLRQSDSSLDVAFAVWTSMGLTLAASLSIASVRLARRKGLFLMVLAPLVASGSALVLLHLLRLFTFATLFWVDQEMIINVSAVAIPPLLFAIPFVVLEIWILLVGSELVHAQRAWLGRFRNFGIMLGLLWLGLAGCSLTSPFMVSWLITYTGNIRLILSTGIATILAGILTRKAARSEIKSSEKNVFKQFVLERIQVIAPVVFLSGLMLLLLIVASNLINPLIQVSGHSLMTVYGVSTVVAILLAIRVDLNETSLMPLYRDRLARCYAGASDIYRQAESFSGFSGADLSVRLGDLLPRSYRYCSDNLLNKRTNGHILNPFMMAPFPFFALLPTCPWAEIGPSKEKGLTPSLSRHFIQDTVRK